MSATRTEFKIQPNSACNDRSWRWLFGSLVVLSFTIAIRFAVLGYWMILPFTVLEISALALVLWIVLRKSNHVEKVVIVDQRVVIEHLEPGNNQNWYFPLYWTQVKLIHASHRWYPHRLIVGCKGEWVEIGRCLTNDERQSLAEAIREVVNELKNRLTPMLEATTHGKLQWRQYLELCKPKVVLLILFTALVGMFLSTEGLVPFNAWFWGLIGIGLAASAGAALNHWVDEEIDARMERTSSRPLPQGDINGRQAVTFALTLATLSMIVLLTFINVLTAILTFASMVGYAVIYTMFLKRSTPQNIVLGGAAGAAPPVLGWTAVTGELHSEALLLFLIIFIWTPPHFWALAIKRVDDYARAEVPMLPVTHGIAFTKLHILLYTILLVVVTILPFLILMSGTIYLAGAIALGVGFVYHAVTLYRSEGDQHAMKTFGYSIFYLSALFGFLLLDHYARIVIRTFFLD